MRVEPSSLRTQKLRGCAQESQITLENVYALLPVQRQCFELKGGLKQYLLCCVVEVGPSEALKLLEINF